jgi:beta-lactamase superfamily II metal-dependent hydrolase
MNVPEPHRSPPAPDEMEVALFGPGVGECLVIHLGGGSWMVVDSCLLAGEPVALWYLDALGVPRGQVRHLVVTHWHDDHHKGAARLVEALPSARVHCSGAVATKEFRKLIASGGGPTPTDIDEFHGVLTQLHARMGGTRTGVAPEGLRAGTRFVNIGGGELPRAEAWALSPSPMSITRTLQEIGGLLPQQNAPKRRLVSTAPNESSVAIMLKFGSRGVLLGSDLEEEGDAARGWQAVVANHGNVGGRSDVYKVAHHGSPTAHHQPIYADLLNPGATAVLTPFRRSKLPGEADIARVTQQVSALHQTATTEGRKVPSREPTVERILRDAVKNRRAETTDMGMVRLRFRETGPISVQHFGGAFQAA